MMDQIIIETVKIVGWLFFVAAGLGLVLLSINYAWKIWRNALAFQIWREAVKEYKKNHPEKFKTLI